MNRLTDFIDASAGFQATVIIGCIRGNLNPDVENPDVVQAVLDSGDLLGYVHFTDSNHWYVGAGHIDFLKIMHVLKSIGYEGCISA